MKLLVVNDYYCYENNGTYYFESEEKRDFYYRYLRVFENLRLVTRCIHEEKLKPTRIPIEDSRIEYIPVPVYHGPSQYVKSYRAIDKTLRNIIKDCDRAILQLPCTIAMHTSKYIIKSKIPYATEVVYDAEDGWRSENNIVRKLLWKRIDSRMRSICRKAYGVACVTSQYLQQHYFSNRKNAFVSNYSSLALPKDFYGQPRKYPTKSIFTIVHIANKIFYEGRKGHLESIKAIGVLKQKGIIVNICFAGAIVDNSPEKLENYAKTLGIESQIKFLGFLNRSELSTFLNNADIFILPTKAEGLPRVLIEAMAKGLPCVTTNVSGNSELIDKDYLVDYDDVEGLAKKLQKLICEATSYENESINNFSKSKSYEASILESRRDNFYNELKNIKSAQTE